MLVKHVLYEKHPWFLEPLPGKYAMAEKHALAEQERLYERLRSRAINTVRNMGDPLST
jgi:hypothetical protein